MGVKTTKYTNVRAAAIAAATLLACTGGVQAGAAPTKLLIDFNSTTQDGGPTNQAGYRAYDAASTDASSFIPRSYGTDFPHVGFTSVTLTPAWPNTTNEDVQQAIDRDAIANDVHWGGTKLDLVTDWIGSDTRGSAGGNGNFDGTTGTPTWLTLSLGTLPASNYSWKSFHHDTEHVHSQFTIELSTDGGANFSLVHSGQMTDSTGGGNPASSMTSNTGDPEDLPSTAMFDFPTGGGEVILRFTPLAEVDVHLQFFGINGFELCDLGDFVSPVITVPKDIVVNAPDDVEVTYPPATATDDVSPANPEVTCFPPSGSVFPIGTTKVFCSAIDDHGNFAEECFFVTVVEIQDSPTDRFFPDLSLRGDPVPGPLPKTNGIPGKGKSGATFLSYQHAYLSESGFILEATLAGAGANNTGLFIGAKGLASIGIKGTGSPTGPDYIGFKDPVFSEDGFAAFGARTTGGDMHLTDEGNSTTIQVGSPPPGMMGDPIVRALFQQALGEDGELFSPSSLLRGSGTPAVTPFDDTLIWSSDVGTVAREGAPAEDMPPGVTYGHLSSRVVANRRSRVAFAGNLTGAGSGNAAVWSGVPGGLSVVAQRGNPAPGTGGTFGQFAAESINEFGDIAFRSTLNLGGSVTTANNECLWTDRNGGLELIAREGSDAPCIEATGVVFGRFDTLFINSGGDIVFFAFLKGAGISSANDGSIWRSDPDGNVHLIAREGDLANSTDGGVYANLQAVSANDGGNVLFFGRLVTGIGDTLTSNNFGAWLSRRDFFDLEINDRIRGGFFLGPDSNVPELLVRKGDTLEDFEKGGKGEGDSPIITGVGFDYVSNSVGGTGGYGETLVSDFGVTLLKLTLSGNSAGVFGAGEIFAGPRGPKGPKPPIIGNPDKE